MDKIVTKAYAKINLGLDVLRRREDGYHEVKMVMQTVDLYDVLLVSKKEEDTITISTQREEIPVNEDNLIYKAIKLMKDQYGFETVTFDDSSAMYQDVIGGNSAACFEDYPVMGYGITQGVALKMVTDKEQGSSYGFAVGKGINTELLEMFDAGLANLKENGKYAECNAHFFCSTRTTEKFRHQYAEYLREMHEMGIPITFGSDSHNAYEDTYLRAEEYLIRAGFRDGDIVEIREESFWK